MGMVIIVNARVELWKQIWSWPVVGGILFLLLSSGVTFSTTDHSLLGDFFFSASAVLFMVKFLTWEDARQLDRPKRNKSYGLAIGLTLIVLCAMIWGNHRLSASRQAAPGVIQSSSVQHPPEATVENTPKAGASGTQNPQSPEKQTPVEKPKATKQQGKTSVKGHGNASENNVLGDSNGVGTNNRVNSPAAPNIQINNAPNGIAIGGGTVVNPTVNNYPAQTKPDRTVTDADRMNIVAYLSQIKATVSLKAPYGDKEATSYAIFWYGIFKDARWTMKDRIVLAYMTVGGNPTPGAILYEKGEPPQPGKEIPVPNTDPIAYVATALKRQNVPIALQRDLNQEEGVITIQFGPKPD